jgi:CelD/BcsL family acetyltransferase involved in cellulose biosynthesis
MAAVPILEETSGGPSAAMVTSLAGLSADTQRQPQVELLESDRPPRRLTIYPASACFDLVEELDHLCARTVEPNIFFHPRFLVPAMPRLEDREVKLAVIRDGGETRDRLRLLVPFSVERPAVPFGVAVMRAWSNPFGPLGTPLLDRDDPAGVVEDFLSMLARPHLKLPRVLVFPDILIDGPVASLLRTVALGRNLALVTTSVSERPFLESSLDGEDYLKRALSTHHLKELRRLKRRLAERGKLEYRIRRQPDEIRLGVEAFLMLEASGWKGRKRTAMATDRYRAAFAREAVDRLAERDLCRVHSLTLDDRVIACLIVFIEAGVAYTWKTAYDEELSAFSPGTLLMMEATKNHLEDPNIMATDSCAAPHHPVVGRLWRERRTTGTLLVGLSPDADRAVRQAATQLHLHRETRNLARVLRNRISRLTRQR